ncbi:hypothetical protein DL96DRAFT_1716264 [Flagelloscypha sp. PMI_526]|nr:hypothetical protein DL96DRAFT_1716264 [Flagelloscypha sp. PMI_526]
MALLVCDFRGPSYVNECPALSFLSRLSLMHQSLRVHSCDFCDPSRPFKFVKDEVQKKHPLSFPTTTSYKTNLQLKCHADNATRLWTTQIDAVEYSPTGQNAAKRRISPTSSASLMMTKVNWYNSDVTSEERLAHAQGGKCIGLDEGGQKLCSGHPYSGHFTTCSYHADQAPPTWTKPAKSPTSDNLIYLDIYQMYLNVLTARFALGSRLSRRHQAHLQRTPAAAAAPASLVAAASPPIASSSGSAVPPPPYEHRSSARNTNNSSAPSVSTRSQSDTLPSASSTKRVM